MKKYKINRTNIENLPLDETINKYKDYSKLQVRYNDVVKRNKLPLYKNRKMFLFIILIVLLAYLIASGEFSETDEIQGDPIEQSQ
ncbi:MAG: hypothetical protein P8M05_12550 [Flavobacteriales bacterium]|jgi:hypothetical protein|nr:hypothetical protein [Crocinitomicaceae bacterium]MDG2332414.1 hypothetical protein [Flavobacteriales bacterium]